jgi:hypothetical protein
MTTSWWEMDSFLLITELIFREQVSSIHRSASVGVSLSTLSASSSRIHSLDELKRVTMRWKHLMVKLYGGIAEQQQTEAQRSSRGRGGRSLSRAEKAAGDTSKMTASKLLSFKFPNFKVMPHWAELIPLLGPVGMGYGAVAPCSQDNCVQHQPAQ